MTDPRRYGACARAAAHRGLREERRVSRRRLAERLFRACGAGAAGIAVASLVALLAVVVVKASSAFMQTEILLDLDLDPARLGLDRGRDAGALRGADYEAVVKAALRELFPEIRARRDRRALYRLVSPVAADEVRRSVLAEPAAIGAMRSLWLPASDDVDMLVKGRIERARPEDEHGSGDRVLGWIDRLGDAGRLRTGFNWRFFLNSDSREPEAAGILGALVGSLLTVLVCLLFAFPLGTLAAVYLETFAPKNRWTDLLEVNINNLAAVPSILFGLLGLVVFLDVLGLPRSAPLVGGMVLALMALPTIIISGRAAIKAVPRSVREAALAMGASPIQVLVHHILPLAMPGLVTGTIVAMARALGDTAPLLMIGMMAFVVDVPGGVLDAAAALPVQIYLWADSPERAFEERTAAAIVVLLLLFGCMSLLATLLRRRFEKRW